MLYNVVVATATERKGHTAVEPKGGQMKIQSTHRVVAIIALVVVVLLFLILSRDTSRAGISPLHSPLAASQSPLPVPGLSPGLPAAPASPDLLSYGPKGIGGGNTWGNLDYDVWYNWGVLQNNTDPALARMVYCPTDEMLYELGDYQRIIDAAQNDYANDLRGRVWLVFNEPDHPWSECGTKFFTPESSELVQDDPEEAAVRYAFVYDTIKQYDPHARVFGGGLVFLNSTQPAGDNTRWWWDTFLDTLEANDHLDKLKGVHVHAYGKLTISPVRPEGSWELDPCPHENCFPELAQALNDWYSDVHEADPRTAGLPIWITETGWPTCGDSGWDPGNPTQRQEGYLWVRDNYAAPISEWFTGNPAWNTRYPGMASNPGYESIFWFVSYTTWKNMQYSWWCTFLNDYFSDPQGELTPAGEYWNQLPLTSFDYDASLPLVLKNHPPPD